MFYLFNTWWITVYWTVLKFDDLPPPEGDEGKYYSVPSTTLLKGAIEEKWLIILIPKNKLIRLPILLAQVKPGNNSCKLPHKIRQIVYLSYQHNDITRNVYSNLIQSLY